MRVRSATKEAIARKVATLGLVKDLLATWPIDRGDYTVLIDKANRDVRTIYLLRRRLRRTRLRVKWWNVVTMLGASALFVWFILTILEGM